MRNVMLCLAGLIFSVHPVFSQNTFDNVKTWKAQIFLDTRSTLGEGALWDYKHKRLLWIDIEKSLLHIYSPKSGKNETYELGSKPGTVVPEASGDLILALQDGIYRFNPETKEEKLLVENPEKKTTGNRFNDGKVGPDGRLWVGTTGRAGTAALYNYANETPRMRKKLQNITTSNGIVWSSDKKKMYYADTPTREIKVFDFDAKTGDIEFKKVAITIPVELGSPDGMAIDSEGMIWIAHWGGYTVGRWNPENGKLLGLVEVPASNVSSCAFGGDKLDVLYITTAASGAREDQLQKFPHSGSVFYVKPGVKGVPTYYFK
ncbi:MAG: SMP-30/gluconolactonase/LRE family protein [Bacteroidales bacterium]|nr:SMP-30/gluconolactonase/LRE family protein [Bacteroidales bacterium]